jgi:hypothetical protein
MTVPNVLAFPIDRTASAETPLVGIDFPFLCRVLGLPEPDAEGVLNIELVELARALRMPANDPALALRLERE